jgi:hypothetical protein
MKFIKHRISSSELASELLKRLPPLEERFLSVHGYDQKPPDTADRFEKPSDIHWNFGDELESKSLRELPIANGPVVRKQLGRFTVTSGTNTPELAPKPSKSENEKTHRAVDELGELKLQISALTAENKTLKDQVIMLAREIKLLKENM